MISLLAVIYIVFISLGLPDSLFGVAWPVVHTEFGIAQSFASVYGIITGLCSGGASFVAGKLLRRFGTANVTFVSIMLTALGLIGISFSPNIWVMMFFSVVLGYGAGAIDTGLNNYVSLHYKARHMNWLHCFWGIGVTASPMIMSRFLVGEVGAWRNGYRIIALIQFLIAIIVAVFLSKWHKCEKEGTSSDSETEKKREKVRIFRIKGVPTSIITLGMYCSMEFLLGTWGATYLVNTRDINPDSAARFVSLYFGGILLGRFISGFVSMKLKDKTLIRGGFVIALCGAIVLALPIGSVSVLGLLLIGIGFGPIFPSIIHSVPERFGSEYSADITGYHMGGAYAMGFATQLSFGYIASAIGFNITPFVVMCFCLAGFFFNEITLRLISKPKIKTQSV